MEFKTACCSFPPSGPAGGSALSRTVSSSLFMMRSENSSFAEIQEVSEYLHLNRVLSNKQFEYGQWYLTFLLSSLHHLCRLGGKGDLLLKNPFVLPPQLIPPSLSTSPPPSPFIAPVLSTATIKKKKKRCLHSTAWKKNHTNHQARLTPVEERISSGDCLGYSLCPPCLSVLYFFSSVPVCQ